jgi:hypothetical protein
MDISLYDEMLPWLSAFLLCVNPNHYPVTVLSSSMSQLPVNLHQYSVSSRLFILLTPLLPTLSQSSALETQLSPSEHSVSALLLPVSHLLPTYLSTQRSTLSKSSNSALPPTIGEHIFWTPNVNYCLSFTDQGKQTFVFHLQKINGSLTFLFSVCNKQNKRKLPFSIVTFSVFIYIYTVVGKVTVIKLLRYVTSYFFK